MPNKTLFILFLAWLNVQIGFAQAQGDTLYWSEIRNLALLHHPLIQRAELQNELAQAGLLSARGGFDLKTYADLNVKTFEKKNYFRYADAGVKLPIGIGMELSGGYTWASGQFLNPESTLPSDGQAQLGLRWTLGRGLFIDERRAGRQQAEIGLDLLNQQSRLERREVLQAAEYAYWNWVFHGNALYTYQESLSRAQERFVAVRESFIQGDKPAIDTLESFIQVQNWQMELQSAQLNFNNAGLELGKHLWNEQGQNIDPLTLGNAPTLPGLIPSLQGADSLNTLINRALTDFPGLNFYGAKLRQLETEQRLNREWLKPELEVEYKFLGSSWNFFPTEGVSGPAVLANDTKYGIRAAFPIPNRKARGKLQQTTIKLAQVQRDQTQKTTEVRNELERYVNALNTLLDQVEMANEMNIGYRRLLDAEYEKFRFGESSVFLVNSREQKWLQSRLKLLKLIAEHRKADVGLRFYTGE